MPKIQTVVKWFLGIIAYILGQKPVPQQSGTRSLKQRLHLSNPMVTIFMVVVGVMGMSEVSWGQTTYYLQNANVASAHLVSSWKTDATGAGGGTAASNFTTNGNSYNTLSGQNAIFDASITLGSGSNSGSGVTINIASGSTATIKTTRTITLSGKGGNSSKFNVNGTIIFEGTGQIYVSIANAACQFNLNSGSTFKTDNTNGLLGTNASINQVAGSTVSLSTQSNYEFNNSGNQSMTGLPATVNNLTISGSGTKNLPANTIVSGMLTVSENSTLALSTFTLGSPTSIVLAGGASTGSSITGSGLLTLGGNVTINNAATGNNGATISCPVALTNSTTRTFSVADDGTSASDLSISGIISTSGNLTKVGAGKLTLSGVNTYTGATTISAGVLNIQNATATGTTAGGVTVASGAALEIQNGITVGAETLSLSGSGISNGGALRSVGTGNLTNTWGGTITLSAASRINCDASSTLSVGAISGTNVDLSLGGLGNINVTGAIATGTGSLTDDGPGNVTLSGTNTYTGNTTISAGITSLGASDVLSNSSNMVLSGGTFKTGTGSTGFSDQLGTLNLNANSTIAFVGSTSHTLTFAASDLVTWNGTVLTITGWTGTAGSSGTGGKLFVGNSSSGLTSAQIAKIQFTGYTGVATQLSTGEVVPGTTVVAPVISSATTASSTYGASATYNITANNTPTSYDATGLPTGMTVNTTTGVITVASTTTAGSYSISISASNAGGTGSATLTYTVNAAPLTVTATAQSKAYGSNSSTSGTLNTNFTVSGLVGSDAVSGATLSYSGSPAGNLGTAAVGSYTITPSALTLSSGLTSNYTINYVNGTLTVNTANLTITGVSASNKTYDGTTTATFSGTASYTG